MKMHDAHEQNTFYDPETDPAMVAMGRSVVDVKASEQEWVIEGVIPKCSLTTFYGSNTVERRRFLLQWAYHAGYYPGISWRGREVEAQSFIYYVTRNVDETRRMFDAIAPSADGIAIMLCSITKMLSFEDYFAQKFLWMDQKPWVIIGNRDHVDLYSFCISCKISVIFSEKS